MTTSLFIKKATNRLINYFLDFELMLLYFVGCVPSHHLRRFCYRISGVRIGKGSAIHTGCRFFNPTNIEIGDDTVVGDNAFLDGRARLKIGSHVAIASSIMIYNSEHDIEDEN